MLTFLVKKKVQWKIPGCLLFENTRKNVKSNLALVVVLVLNLKLSIFIWVLSLLTVTSAQKFTKKSRNHSVISFKINSPIQKFLQGDFIVEWFTPKNLSSDLKVRATVHLAKTCSRSENLSPCLSQYYWPLFYRLISLCVKSGCFLDSSRFSLFLFANIFCHYFFPNHSCKFTFVSRFLSEVFNATRLNKIVTVCLSLFLFWTQYLTLSYLYLPVVVSHIY